MNLFAFHKYQRTPFIYDIGLSKLLLDYYYSYYGIYQ